MQQKLEGIKLHSKPKRPECWVVCVCTMPADHCTFANRDSLHGWLSRLKSLLSLTRSRIGKSEKAGLVNQGPSFYLPLDLSSRHCQNNSLYFDLAVNRSGQNPQC